VTGQTLGLYIYEQVIFMLHVMNTRGKAQT